MIRSLESKDCFSIEPNDNFRYPEATVYKFRKEFELSSFGIEENVKVYIKMYIMDLDYYEKVMVISFHRDDST